VEVSWTNLSKNSNQYQFQHVKIRINLLFYHVGEFVFLEVSCIAGPLTLTVSEDHRRTGHLDHSSAGREQVSYYR
jgi:hypothetical protein